MTDLVERLKKFAHRSQKGSHNQDRWRLIMEAADAIERLDLAYLRVVGWRERDWPEGFDRRTADLIAEYAREAMEEKP